jgi:ankyrin repeat protein
MGASEAGQRDVVQALLAANVDLNARTAKGETALTVALRRGRRDIAELLRRYGARE